MVASSGVPEADLARVAEAEARLLAVVATASDADMRRPSALPGWTVGHLLTHVARNADSHVRRALAAARGEVVDQYEGGFAGRAAEIEAGAGRTAAEIVEDVRVTAAAAARAWREVPPTAWGNLTRDVGGRERPLRALPARRWQELEVHLVDADLGVTARSWSDEFVAAWLPRLRDGAADRLPPGSRLPEPGVLDERDELAWLYGRLRRRDLPELAPWA